MEDKNAINILHISDLHYKISRSYDQKIVLESLLEDLKSQNEKVGPPDIIVFSGDLVHSADDERVYDSLYDNFIEELLRVANCSHSQLYMSPGNHDLERSSISKELLPIDHDDIALSRDSLNKAYIDGRAGDIAQNKLNKYFEFEDFFDADKELYRDRIISVYDIEHLNVSILNINTAWLGWAGLNDIVDLQRLAVPEAAIHKAIQLVPENRYTICNFHHPIEWHTEDAGSTFRGILEKKADLLLYGHVHDPRPFISSNGSTSAIYNQSGALYTWRDDRYMGYSLIRLNSQTKHTELVWRSYYDRRQTFDTAINVNDNHGIVYSSIDAEEYFTRLLDPKRKKEIGSWVYNNLLPIIKDKFSDGILDKPLPDLYVSPPLSLIVPPKNDDEDLDQPEIEIVIELNEIVFSASNYLIESYPEHGKTTLLQEICARKAQENKKESLDFHNIPVFLKFNSFRPGTRRVEKAIRDWLPGLPENCTIPELLLSGSFTIIVDDIVLNDKVRLSELKSFVENNKNNKFIFSTTTMRHHDAISASANLGAHFNRVRLHQFRRTDLRELAKKIDSNSGSSDELLDRVVSELKAINVPATPINSSLLMDILIQDNSFSPINRPTLIERFIETLLKKRSLKEIERKRFDFRNQVHYLGHVAQYMCRNDSYVLEYDDLFSLTVSYLADLGLNFGSQDIIDNNIVSKIFLRKEDNQISFRFRAFLEFFIATSMRENSDFKSWILHEDRYLSYLNEIEYYSGLERNDLDLLRLISERHLENYKNVFGAAFDRILDDKLFQKLPTSLEGSEKFAEELANQMQEVPLTAAERDEVLDTELPRDAEGRQEVFRPIASSLPAKYILSLFMYTNLVKNTELIEDTEKRYHLSCVLKSWSSTIVGSFLSIPSLVKNRRMSINGLSYIVLYPREFSHDEVARRLAIGIPKEISRLVHVLIGTEKLERQLVRVTSQEKNEPNVTAFLRSSLCIDLKLTSWWKEPKKFIDKVKGDSYFQRAMLSKAADVYRLGSFTKVIEKDLEDDIVDVYSKLYSPSRAKIQDIRNKKKTSMRKFNNIKSLRAKLPKNEK